MNTFDIVFCVLTYKNHIDLTEFLNSVENNATNNYTYKVIVVNNYADDESLETISKIALLSNCDFIENDNTGYGDGNNRGIDYIQKKYNYKFLIVCNPDTLIEKLTFKELLLYSEVIIAPKITKITGKDQNPMNYSYMKYSEFLLYRGFLNKSKFSILLGLLGIKCTNFIAKTQYKMKKKPYVIHSCHGSFIIFEKKVVDKLNPIFDSNIFLFCEEGDLAMKCKSENINIIYNDNIYIKHKEDGSMKTSKLNLNQVLKKSYIYYYQKWNN